MIPSTMKKTCLFIFAALSLTANPFKEFSAEPKIAVQNSILAQVNGKTISMIDVKKKMDMVFHQNYPHLADSARDRFQFYQVSWRFVLMEMIDNELILSDAADKEIKVTDGEVREAMEERFGPNIMQTLDKIGLTYDETWKLIKDEITAQRMRWWFIQSKAVTSVTPQDIRQAYRLYLKEHPAYSECSYKVISIKAEEPNESLAEKAYQILSKSNQPPNEAKELLKEIEAAGVAITVSNEFNAKTQDLSEAHKAALETLSPNTYSRPVIQISKTDKKAVYKIFYLAAKNEHLAPTFEAMAPQLRGELTQKAVEQESAEYLGKLRKHYGFEADKTIPEDLHPFSLQ